MSLQALSLKERLLQQKKRGYREVFIPQKMLIGMIFLDASFLVSQ